MLLILQLWDEAAAAVATARDHHEVEALRLGLPAWRTRGGVCDIPHIPAVLNLHRRHQGDPRAVVDPAAEVKLFDILAEVAGELRVVDEQGSVRVPREVA